ncbi:MAG: aminopeptidase [Thermoguttaceae bacterium]|nr:aminopeptidase [Thermoguttaceae bacterium]
MNSQTLQKYAELLARCGLNVQKGQEVLIIADLDQPEFVTMCVEECYRAGAKKVLVDWIHQPVTKLHYENQTLETLSTLEKWQLEKWAWQVDQLPCKLYIESEDPDGLAGADQEKISKARQNQFPLIKPFRDAMENKYQWCIAAVPGKAWAKKVFPDLPEAEAVEALWKAILSTSRALEGEPLENWAEHNQNLKRRYDYLNALKLKSLRYTSKNGTDFTVGLIDGCKFLGGGELTTGGNYFNPNIPSEEIFTSPKAGEAEGIVYATKPLSYQGALIENFWVRFEGGRAVEVGAEKNVELLQQMIEMDDGAAKLGECALIPFDSPINNTGILFFNTLFDENASCHLALGRGFSNLLEGFENLTIEECKERGINNSMIHVDFMIGSRDLCITGTTRDGREVEIFRDGGWAF